MDSCTVGVSTFQKPLLLWLGRTTLQSLPPRCERRIRFHSKPDSIFKFVAATLIGLRYKLVRVLRMWLIDSFMKPGEISYLEMVLIDEKGGKIHATVRKQLLYLFQTKFKEGNVYKLSHFAVALVVGSYCPTLHPHKLIFQMKTKVQICESADIPLFGLSFTDFAEVSTYSADYQYLIDVIGLITGMSNEREYLRDGKVTKMVVLELTDTSGKCECALFGDYVDELQRLIGKSPSGLHIVVIQFAKVKVFREKLSIQNVMNTTRIFVDPDIKEAADLRKELAMPGIQPNPLITLIGARVRASFEEDFINSDSKKSIEELLCLNEEGTFVISASIQDLVDGEDWWYHACKCQSDGNPFRSVV